MVRRWSCLSLSARVRITAVGFAAVTIALVALLMASAVGLRVAIPGPLRTSHAPLSERCDACHTKSPSALQSLRHGFASTDLALAQSAKCTVCHDLGENPMRVHGWSAQRLKIIHNRAAEHATDAVAPLTRESPEANSVAIGPDGRIACAMCHREHGGRQATLATLSDSQCQTCHTNRFAGFGDGHPPFTDYPHMGRTRLIFSHSTHISKHFTEDKMGTAPDACTDCHVPAPDGRSMLVRGFDQSCASCHEPEIRGSAQVDHLGLPFLALPSLDTQTLRDAGVAIGDWPADASDTETPITPFMSWLLSNDPSVGDDLSDLSEVDLLDLTDASEAQLAAVGRVAWAVKQLFLELQSDGHAALRARLEVGTRHPIDDARAAALLGQLPGEVIRAAIQTWLPDLEGDVARQGALAPRMPDEPDERADADELALDPRRETWVSAGGWYRQDLDFSIRYRPGGHADAFLHAWLDLAGQFSQATDTEPPGQIFALLSDPDAVGLCTKCHRVDADPRSALLVNWKSNAGSVSADDVTTFAHATHFPMIGDRGCLTCHTLSRDNEDPPSTFDQRDRTSFVSQFRQMTLSTCTQCHTQRKASVQCLTCHYYHARASSIALPSAPLIDAADKDPQRH